MTNFLLIFTDQAFSLFGSHLVQFVLVWWLTVTSSSASILALASIIALLPQIFLSPFAGSLVDRWNRRTVMIVADSLIALGVVVLAALYARNIAQIWHIYVLMFFRSAGGAFHWPAMQWEYRDDSSGIGDCRASIRCSRRPNLVLDRRHCNGIDRHNLFLYAGRDADRGKDSVTGKDDQTDNTGRLNT